MIEFVTRRRRRSSQTLADRVDENYDTEPRTRLVFQGLKPEDMDGSLYVQLTSRRVACVPLKLALIAFILDLVQILNLLLDKGTQHDRL